MAERKVKQRAKPGPKADTRKEAIGVYLPCDLLAWVRGQMRGPKDLSAVIAMHLERAKVLGWRAFTDGDVK